jgi:hypothetical protein
MTWKQITGDAAKRKSDLNQAAFGTRCEPKLLPAPLLETLTAQANDRWAAVSDGQSPGDVARFGTDDVQRAAAAYAVLRLSAVSLPAAQAAEAEADAMRIVNGMHDKLQLTDGGPYRSAIATEPLETK